MSSHMQKSRAHSSSIDRQVKAALVKAHVAQNNEWLTPTDLGESGLSPSEIGKEIQRIKDKWLKKDGSRKLSSFGSMAATIDLASLPGLIFEFRQHLTNA
jgi:hypothetical protein